MPTTVADFLREETNGGRLLLLATAIALVWANLAEESYADLWGTHLAVGPEWLHLDLSLADWASDGLLAVFFLVAGVEVKRELTVGELADRRAAALPVLAAVGGMVVPALVAIAVSGGDALDGGAWATPVATDIAFALGVLALSGALLPSGVRILLLSLAVIDDLLAIALIAVLFTKGFAAGWLLGGLALCLVWRALLQDGRSTPWPLLVLVAVAAWVAIHASGVHATVAGLLLGLLAPVGAGHRLEHRVHPFSAGVAVPIFAIAAAGIPLGAAADFPGDPVAMGILLGLLVGKLVGILGGARLAVRLGVGSLPPKVRWGDVVPVALLGGVGYTVSLLIARLSLTDPDAEARAAAAVLVASVLASLGAVVLLRRRSRG